MQDLSQLSGDAVRPYMLLWDVRKLLKCLDGLLSPKPACYGYHEPSLFCTARGLYIPCLKVSQLTEQESMTHALHFILLVVTPLVNVL